MENIEKIKECISTSIPESKISVKNITLFGSRARGNYEPFSDYDLLIIIDKPLKMKEKMMLSKNIREALAGLYIDVDIVIKSEEEANNLRGKIGSVVRNALKEGVAI